MAKTNHSQGFKSRLGEITKIKSQNGEPVKMESGQTIINKKATEKNLQRLVEINKDSSKKTSAKETNDGTVGGLLEGRAHYDKDGKPLGGIKVIVDNNKEIEVEGKEFVINEEASKKHWAELSKINQSAGNGVPINPPNDFDEDPAEFKEGGRVIDFNPNRVPSKMILNYAKKIKKNYPAVWDLGGNIFGNEAFENLKRVSERGYWLDSEEWMYIKWRSYVARHIHDFRIEGVIAMLKWVDKVEKGWPYMKNLIEEEIEKRKDKMSDGGKILNSQKDIKNYALHVLDGFNPKYVGYSDTNGHSMYFDVNGVKVRFSDHSVTNIDRIFNEIHFNLPDTKKIDSDSSKFDTSQSILQLRYKLGDKNILYGKRQMLMPSGKMLEAFGFTEIEKHDKGGAVTYKNKYNKKYGYSKNESHNFKEISKDTGVSSKGLQQIYNKGIGAFKTNPESVRPNVKSKEQWAKARVYSAVMGGKAAKVDAKELKMEKGGGLNDCIYFIKNSEAIKNNGYCLEFKNLSIYIDSGDKVIPNIKSIFLITYNSGGQKNLKPTDTINSNELANKLANLLNVEIGVARIIVSEQVTHSKRFEINIIDSIVNKNIIIADRDTIVCTNLPMKLSNGGLIAPNGKASNLTPDQYKLVRTPQFKAWFGDWENDPKNASKVVDENGEPMVVYRGDSSASKKGNIFKTGFNRMSFISKTRLPNQYFHYFVNNFDVALGYAKNQIEGHNDKVEDTGKGKLWNAKVTSYFLNIKNYLDLTPANPSFPTFSEYEKSELKIQGKERFQKEKFKNAYDYGFYITSAELNKILENKLGKKYLENTKETEEVFSYISEWEKDSFRNSYYSEKTFAYFIEYKDSHTRSAILRRIYLQMLKNNVDGLVFLESTHWDGGFFGENYPAYASGKLKYDYKKWTEKPKVFAALESNQIKLADGTNITFDQDNPDIRFDDGGEIEHISEMENTNKLISELKKYSTKTTSDVMTNAEGERYVFHNWKLKYPHASNWLVKLFEKAAYENIGKTFVPQFSSGDTLFTYERPEFKGRPNGTMRMKVLEVLNKFRLGGNTDDQDKITVNIPLMIRLLEHSREDINSDAELHFVVENLLRLKNKKTLTMEDYNYIAHVQKKHLKN